MGKQPIVYSLMAPITVLGKRKYGRGHEHPNTYKRGVNPATGYGWQDWSGDPNEKVDFYGNAHWFGPTSLSLLGKRGRTTDIDMTSNKQTKLSSQNNNVRFEDMARVGKSAGKSSKRSNRRKRLNKRKKRKGTNLNKKKVRKMIKRIVKAQPNVAAGPKSTTELFWPNTASATGFYQMWDVVAQAFSTSGYLTSAKDQMNIGEYVFMDKSQLEYIVTEKGGASEQATAYAANDVKRLFDPPILGGRTSSGLATQVRNFHKDSEIFVIDKMKLTVHLVTGEVPCRIWIDVWRAKKYSVNEVGVTDDMYESYTQQDYFQGLGARTQPSKANLFKEPTLQLLKIKGRTLFAHKKRVELFLQAGQERQVAFNLGGYVYDGKKVESMEDTIHAGTTLSIIQGMTHCVTISTLGLVGREPATPFQAGYCASSVGTLCKMTFTGHRKDRYVPNQKQYVLASMLPKTLPATNPGVLELNRTFYDN